ncbi:Alpha/Beta hydrolase protein [Phyllosticta citribraziliensis]|uniref:Alpha/Beta hydrolase protein n=1 Tax=Phyllosticta citribraziliensis TaxID=989973 RepID=A0ABR1LZX2_9PEZI
MHTKAFVLAALSTVVASEKTCLNQTVPVTISSRNGNFSLKAPSNNIEATAFVQNLSRPGQNYSSTVLSGYNTVSGTYNISTKFCYDNDKSGTDAALQILTHGIGFDKTYWDLPYNNYNYSYINAALAAGYSTLSYDRLGIGNSSHGDAVNEIQSFLEVEALRSLTTQLRKGSFPGVNQKFKKIIHGGHSFGSIQSYSFANLYPTETDGLILTGFSLNSTYNAFFLAGGNFQLASLNAPLRFGNLSEDLLHASADLSAQQGLDVDLTANLANLLSPSAGSPQNLPSGYLVTGNPSANQYNFFLPGYFDAGLLYESERTKQPVTVGELLTLSSLSPTNAFAGPVLVITGSADLPFCGGDCLTTGTSSPSIPATVSKSFINVAPENFTAYIQPNAGHGLNAHYNATGAYAYVNQWLKAHGLGAN